MSAAQRIRSTAGRVRAYFSCSQCHGSGYRTERVPVTGAELSPRQAGELLALGGPFYREAWVPCTHGAQAARAGWFWLAYADDDSTGGELGPGAAWAIVQAPSIDDAPAVAAAQGISRGRRVVTLELPDGFIPYPDYAGRLFTGPEGERLRATCPPVYGAWAGAGS